MINGRVHMVNVGPKKATHRLARARCEVQMKPETLTLLQTGKGKKGDALTVAKVAGILAAKKTSDFIPLCHPIPLEHIDIRFQKGNPRGTIFIESEIRTKAKTGVEMEALMAAMGAALTLYDMGKAYDPAITISRLRLIEKRGGKSDYSFKGGNHHRV